MLPLCGHGKFSCCNHIPTLPTHTETQDSLESSKKWQQTQKNLKNLNPVNKEENVRRSPLSNIYIICQLHSAHGVSEILV